VWRAQYFLCRSSAVSFFIHEQHRLSLLNWQRHSRRDIRLLQPAFHQRPSVVASFGAPSTDELIAGVLANPKFCVSLIKMSSPREAEKAIALPAQNAFRRMHLNEWTEQAERWIDMAAWDACDAPVSLELLRGRPCFGGLDLSTTTDVTALAWVFPPEHEDGLWQVLSRYFVPEENLRKRAERDRVPYDLWAAQGFIEATAGNVVDYGAIEQRILADAALFQVREIAYDPWNATHLALRLQDEGAAMVEFRQGFRSMAAPTRELEKLIVSRKLAHGANPVTRWMAANVAVAQDPAGNLKPAKDKSTERIDGIVALIMAIGRAMVAQEEPQPSYQMFVL
jgi:phage terminase large subunit-like protein